MKKVTILDTTLRDGSYEIAYTFSAADTARISSALDRTGFRFIEVGHGAGLNASNVAGLGRAVATDEEYMQAARGAIKKAKWGMFCIPGIARLQDVKLAAKNGMDFIRIGTNIDRIADSEPFIKEAKKHGMFVAANYMKSHAISPEGFAKMVLKSERWGADMVYTVDSTGSLFPEDLERYYDAIRKVSNIRLGFHGHENSKLSMALALKAAEIGIEFVDSSLQGMGRSSGNAWTETLVGNLERKGFHTGIDFVKAIHLGHNYIEPLRQPKRGCPCLDTVSGYAGFHSSYMPHVQRVAARYEVDPAQLIIEACKKDKVNVDEKILEGIAKTLKKSHGTFLGSYDFNRYVGGEQEHTNYERHKTN